MSTLTENDREWCVAGWQFKNVQVLDKHIWIILDKRNCRRSRIRVGAESWKGTGRKRGIGVCEDLRC